MWPPTARVVFLRRPIVTKSLAERSHSRSPASSKTGARKLAVLPRDMTTISSAQLSDSELLTAIERAAGDERVATVTLLGLLVEVDARGLYLGQGCSSLFTYCTQVLHLSEHAAYHRIEAARAIREYPRILESLTHGALTLTTVALLRKHLRPENYEALLNAAEHKSKREVELQIACLAPKPDVNSMVRRVANKPPIARSIAAGAADRRSLSTVGESVTPPVLAAAPIVSEPRSRTEPLAADRYLLRVTLSTDSHAKLRRAQDLMRHIVPNVDPAVVIDRALSLLVDHLEHQRLAKVSKPSPSPRPTSRGSRHIPAAVRRAVWARDEGRCAFISERGRCGETGRLEFHHLVPFARGGPTTSENISLRCRAHNRYESELVFGAWGAQVRRSSVSAP